MGVWDPEVARGQGSGQQEKWWALSAVSRQKNQAAWQRAQSEHRGNRLLAASQVDLCARRKLGTAAVCSKKVLKCGKGEELESGGRRGGVESQESAGVGLQQSPTLSVIHHAGTLQKDTQQLLGMRIDTGGLRHR